MIRIFSIDNKLRAEVDSEYPFETPLKFEVINGYTNEIIWQDELYNSCWSEYLYPDTNNPIAKLISKSGKTLIEYKWNTMIDGDDISRSFLIWARNNVGSKGIAIGTHDGLSGEWVEPVREGSLEAYLVEASVNQYKSLVENYRDIQNAYPLMFLVTKDGGLHEFYEGENGYTNSIVESITKTYQSKVTSKKIPSISINNLIINLNLERNLDWLHLDVEGIDADLIMSLDENVINLPKVIIYEVVNLSEQKKLDCINWLTSRGYKITGPIGFNIMAYK